MKNVKVFKEKIVCPFKGTLNRPYELSSVKNKPLEKRPTEDDIINALPDVKTYAKTRKSPVQCNGFDLVIISKAKKSDNDRSRVSGISSFDFVFVCVDRKNSEVFYSEKNSLPFHSLENASILNDSEQVFNERATEDYFVSDTVVYLDSRISSSHVPSAIFVSNNIIINADFDFDSGDPSGFIESGHFRDFPTLSFNCLGNLIKKKALLLHQAYKEILKTKLEVVDFCPEERIATSIKLRRNFESQKNEANFRFAVWAAKQTPPSMGFSLVNSCEWHKSSTVVIKNGKERYILGQDEGSYFGCVLADEPKSISDAYKSLIPVAARGVKGVLRQGEWFAIPVKNQKEVPDRYSPDTLMYLEDCMGGPCFQIDSKDSNEHVFSSGELIFSNKGVFARNFRIGHDDHKTMSSDKDVWYTFAKNTALYSFSSDKVD